MVTIGQEFAKERKKQNLSLAEVSKATKIKEEFLYAIEVGDFKALPSSAYAHGFVSNYAKFLGLPVEKSLAIYRREFDEKKNVDVLPKGFSNPDEYTPPKYRFGRTALVIGFIFAFVGGFLFYQYRSAIFNPSIEIETPKEGESISSLTLIVTGKTDPASTLLIDNKQIPIENNGNFSKEIAVFPGDNTLTFRVENKFGRVTTVARKILVRPR
jgi:cytoskeletal protein RodZ